MEGEWFQNAPVTFDGYHVSQDQINALHQYVKGELGPQEAAGRIKLFPEAAQSPLEMNLRLRGVWKLLNETAVALPETQSAIIDLFRTLQTLPPVEIPKGEGEEWVNLDDGDFWHELTGWPDDWYDSFNSYASRKRLDNDVSTHERVKSSDAWSSACAYAARLAVTGDITLTSGGAGLPRAVLAVSEALETDSDDEAATNVKAAAEVFKHAARELLSMCREGRTQGVWERNNGTWNGKKGLSQDRWDYWKKRWAALAESNTQTSQIREIARQIVPIIDDVEGEE